MLGTFVNNRQLFNLIRDGRVYIKPFNKNQMRTIHYPLTASRFFRCNGRDGQRANVDPKFEFTFSKEDENNARPAQEVIFEPNEYLIVQIRQSITFKNGLVGHFIPSSKLIDLGFSLTCGRIESPYGDHDERVRFGMHNVLSKKNVFRSNETIAYLYLIDLRALSSAPLYIPNKEELEASKPWRIREYQKDSGIHPLDEDE